jgi:hypothetical protein
MSAPGQSGSNANSAPGNTVTGGGQGSGTGAKPGASGMNKSNQKPGNTQAN